MKKGRNAIRKDRIRAMLTGGETRAGRGETSGERLMGAARYEAQIKRAKGKVSLWLTDFMMDDTQGHYAVLYSLTWGLLG